MQRVRVPELMDEPSLAPDAHRRALAGLARINALTRSANLLWPTIRDLANEKLTVLDIATGSGDIPLQLWKRAKRCELPAFICSRR